MKARILLALLVFSGTSGCTGQSAKNRFLLAEQLWHEGKYSASVSEYEKVMQKEEGSDLALQAAYRAGLTETLYLGEHVDAIRKFNRVIDLKKHSPLAHEAQRQIGEILYIRLEQHEQVIAHYSKMLETYPKDLDAPEYLMRIGKSQYSLLKFDEAIASYRKIVQLYPRSALAENALFEIGIATGTQAHQKDRAGENSAPLFKDAIQQLQAFIREYPQSGLVGQAKFEIANCYEELDQLDMARQFYEEIRSTYPLPSVVTSRIQRIDQKRPKKSP